MKLPYQPFTLPQDPDQQALLSPDGRTFIAAESEKSPMQPTLWDFADPARPAVAGTLPGTADRGLWSAAFSRDSKLLATRHSPGSFALWDISDVYHPHRLSEVAPTADGQDQLGDVSSPLALSPDGRTLVSGDFSGTFALWDVADPRNPVRLSPSIKVGDENERAEVRFSADGNTVAIGKSLWRIGDLNRLRTEALEVACTRAGRGLNEPEWALYASGFPHRDTC